MQYDLKVLVKKISALDFVSARLIFFSKNQKSLLKYSAFFYYLF